MNVLEELTEAGSGIDRKHVESRVDDWVERIRWLHGQVLRWLPEGWSGAEHGTVVLDEEMMQRFGVKPRSLPVLHLKSGRLTARLEPRGLWIIGANGRVDLIRRSAHYLIVDRSEAFMASDWQVSSLSDRAHQRPLDRNVLAEMLG